MITLDQLTKIINDHILHSANIVFKSCYNYIVVLKMLDDTITNENRLDVVDSKHAKFRANKLFTKMIISKFTGDLITEVYNTTYKNKKILYKVGKVIIIDNYDLDGEQICSTGIHYFKSIESAYYYETCNNCGNFKKWYDNGRIEMEYEIYTKCDSDGHSIIYEKRKSWNRAGYLEIVCNYKDNKLHGKYTSFDETGLVRVKCNYKNNVLHGKYKKWYSNGQLHKKCNYERGILVGKCKTWYVNGKPYISCNYSKYGRLHGKYKKWHRDSQHMGQPYIECKYEYGIPCIK